MYDGDLLEQHREIAVDVRVGCRLHGGPQLLVRLLRNRGADLVGSAALLPAQLHNLVDVSHEGEDGVCQAAIYGIAGGEGGGDDQGAEHEADDDEHGARNPARHVPHADEEHDSVAHHDVEYHRQRHGQRAQQDEHDQGHRDAKQAIHG